MIYIFNLKINDLININPGSYFLFSENVIYFLNPKRLHRQN